MKKLTLNRQVIRNLDSDETADAQGGGAVSATFWVSVAACEAVSKYVSKETKKPTNPVSEFIKKSIK